MGFRVPRSVITTHCAKYMQQGKPVHYPQRVNDTSFAIVAQYQAEYRGIVQYYRLAYNLQQLSQLKRVMELLLVKTLAKKLHTSCRRIYQQMGTTTTNEWGTYQVLEVRVERGADEPPLVAQFGAIPLQGNKWVSISDTFIPIWGKRSEMPQRLLAGTCELCGKETAVEAHHIRKLADLQRKGQAEKPLWVQRMVARRRKSLMGCQPCHHQIRLRTLRWPSLETPAFLESGVIRKRSCVVRRRAVGKGPAMVPRWRPILPARTGSERGGGSGDALAYRNSADSPLPLPPILSWELLCPSVLGPFQGTREKLNNPRNSGVLKITQRGVFGHFNETYSGISQYRAQQFQSFCEAQSFRMGKIGSWHFLLPQNIDVEMEQDGSRGRKCLEQVPCNLSRSSMPHSIQRQRSHSHLL
jgi:hypothetical protein